MAHLDTFPTSTAPRSGPFAALLRVFGTASKMPPQAPTGDTPLPEQLRRDAGLDRAPDPPPSTGAAMLHLMR